MNAILNFNLKRVRRLDFTESKIWTPCMPILPLKTRQKVFTPLLKLAKNSNDWQFWANLQPKFWVSNLLSPATWSKTSSISQIKSLWLCHRNLKIAKCLIHAFLAIQGSKLLCSSTETSLWFSIWRKIAPFFRQNTEKPLMQSQKCSSWQAKHQPLKIKSQGLSSKTHQPPQSKHYQQKMTLVNKRPNKVAKRLLGLKRPILEQKFKRPAFCFSVRPRFRRKMRLQNQVGQGQNFSNESTWLAYSGSA